MHTSHYLTTQLLSNKILLCSIRRESQHSEPSEDAYYCSINALTVQSKALNRYGAFNISAQTTFSWCKFHSYSLSPQKLKRWAMVKTATI